MCQSSSRSRLYILCGIVAVLYTLASPQAGATEWYVGPAGGSGAGTQAQPWSLDYALSDTSNSRVRPGDTIWVMAGDYYPVAANDPRFQVNRQGTQAAPILVRNYQKDRATVHAYFDCGFNNNIGFITKWITFWGLEVQARLLSNPLSTGKAFEVGNSGYPAQNSPGVKIINCILHDCGSGATGDWGSASDHETNGNLMYYCGYDGTDRGHGHGLYVQSKGPQGHGQLHKDNIVFRNFDNGTQLYGTDNAFRDWVTYDGDVFFNNGEISHVSGMVTAMWLAGGQWAQSPQALNINSYTSSTAVGGYFWLDQSYNAVISNGYFVTSSAHTFNVSANNTGLVMTNNTIVGYTTGFAINQYGTGNVYIPGRPASGKRIVVRPNDYEPGRANIIVFNWDHSPTVSVDISPAKLANGAAYEVRDVQNWYAGAVVSGTYNGSPITLPMTGLTVAAPIALPASYVTPPHTAPQFACFVLLPQASDINRAPVVSAGSDQSIQLPTSQATLTGTVSDDGLPANAAVTWTWSQVSGPAAAIASPSALSTSITMTGGAGTYVFRLTASDTALSNYSDCHVTLVGNHAPVVNAGADQYVYLPATTASLAGTISDDGLPAGAAVTHTWSQVSGPAATVADPSALTTSITLSGGLGTYVFRLTANDTALTGSDDVSIFLQAPGTLPNPVLHLPFDDGAGSTAVDTSGGGHNGTLHGSPLPLWTAGQLNGAIQFDGVQNYVQVPAFALNSDFSLAFWFNPGSSLDANHGGYHYLFSNGTIGAQNSITVWFTAASEPGTGADLRTFAADSAAANLNTNAPSAGGDTLDVMDSTVVAGAATYRWNDGKWHHYCLTFSSTAGRTVYVDGNALISDTKDVGHPLVPQTDFYIGSRSDLNIARFWQGGVDELRIYGAALSGSQVRLLFQPPSNAAPLANAGPAQTISQAAACTLTGSISDDGLPTPAFCTAAWTMVSGPGIVTFANPAAAATTASFSTIGTYMLRLTASDTALTGSSDVAVTVLTPGDFNGDGKVDGVDFLAWQTHYPTLAGATLDMGDANGDGRVNGQDFLLWQVNYKPTP